MNTGEAGGVADDVGDRGGFICAFTNTDNDNSRADLVEDAIHRRSSASLAQLSRRGAVAGNQHWSVLW